MIKWVPILDKDGQPSGREEAFVSVPSWVSATDQPGVSLVNVRVGWINKIRTPLLPSTNLYGYYTSTGRLFTDSSKAKLDVESKAVDLVTKIK